MSAFGYATGYPGAPPGRAYGLPAFGWQRQSPDAWVPGRAVQEQPRPPFFDARSLIGYGMVSPQQTLAGFGVAGLSGLGFLGETAGSRAEDLIFQQHPDQRRGAVAFLSRAQSELRGAADTAKNFGPPGWLAGESYWNQFLALNQNTILPLLTEGKLYTPFMTPEERSSYVDAINAASRAALAVQNTKNASAVARLIATFAQTSLTIRDVGIAAADIVVTGAHAAGEALGGLVPYAKIGLGLFVLWAVAKVLG